MCSSIISNNRRDFDKPTQAFPHVWCILPLLLVWTHLKVWSSKKERSNMCSHTLRKEMSPAARTAAVAPAPTQCNQVSMFPEMILMLCGKRKWIWTLWFRNQQAGVRCANAFHMSHICSHSHIHSHRYVHCSKDPQFRFARAICSNWKIYQIPQTLRMMAECEIDL